MEMTEAEALADLLEHPGWVVLEKAMRQMHGPEAMVGKLLGQLRESGSRGSRTEVDAADLIVGNAVLEVLAWPKHRLESLKAMSAPDGRRFARYLRA